MFLESWPHRHPDGSLTRPRRRYARPVQIRRTVALLHELSGLTGRCSAEQLPGEKAEDIQSRDGLSVGKASSGKGS